MKFLSKTSYAAIAILLFTACAEKNNSSADDSSQNEQAASQEESQSSGINKGLGPITNVSLGTIDENLAKTGEEIFTANCSACHKMDKRFVGPALQGVTERRSPEWIMNMILNPDQMVNEDPDAKALLAEYLSPMANQNLTEDQARAILEYFRTQN